MNLKSQVVNSNPANQIKFESPKSSLALKRFIVILLTNLNLRKLKIKVLLLYLANSCFYNYKHFPYIPSQHYVLQNHRKNKDIVITKPDQGNGVVMPD